MRNDIKIVYMGTSEFSSKILEFLIENKVNVVGVVSQPDKEVGRKNKIQPTPVKEVALKYGIEVFQPIKIRDDYEFIANKNPDIVLTCAYGQIVPQAVLDIPKYKCINIHGSLLPKYRGAAPIQYAILNDEKQTGVTYMEMIKKMDAGCMYSKTFVDIENNDNAQDIFDKLLVTVKDTVIDFLDDFVEGKIEGIEQNEEDVTFSKMIKREDEVIDWNDSKRNIHNKVRAFNPSPIAYTTLNDVNIKIYEGEETSENISGEVGEIVKANKEGIFVRCSDGVYKITKLQPAGKKEMDSRDYINGNKDLVGKMFYVREVL
jgi:methionyl-tRNA formyltransferase